jgi:hypothetical protein
VDLTSNTRAAVLLDPSIRRKSLFRRPASFALAAFDAHKPAVCFCRSEQAPIAVPAVGILAKLTSTIRRHRTTHQRQARCLSQQIGPSRDLHCRRTAHNARRDLDSAEIAGAVRPHMFNDWLRCLRGMFARDFAKELFQFFDHAGVPLIDKGLAKTCAICPPFFSRAPYYLGTTTDGNNATGREFSQSVTCEHCDTRLTGRHCKLNGVTLGTE